MSPEAMYSFFIGIFFGAIYFAYGWMRPPQKQSKLKSALKSGVIAFLLMTILARGCAAIHTNASDDQPECDRYPAIYGC